MKIALIGDLHGRLDSHTIFNFLTSQKEHDLIIQCGDFGFVWDGSQSEKEFINKLSRRLKTPLLIVPGNHENYDLIEQLPTCKKFNGKCYKLRDNIFIAKRGQIFKINGKTFLTLSGAMSTDKYRRIEHISWWKQELWTYREEHDLFKRLDKINWRMDYVISHTAPNEIIQKMINPYFFNKILDPTTLLFSEIYRDLKFKEWHFAHMHEDRQIGIFHCHYHNVHMLEI